MLPLPLGTSLIGQDVFMLDPSVRQKHMALFGKSGVGKTTLLQNVLVADIRAGLGVTVIDPHGSLVDELVAMIPRSRTNDVVFFDPSSSSVIGLNPLEDVSPAQRPLVISALVSTIKNIWPDSWGPRSEWILSHAALALLVSGRPSTLVALPRLLVDTAFRRTLLKSVSEPAVLTFFERFDAWPSRLREEAVSPLLNKISKFVTNPMLRDILGQPRSSFDFRWLMDNRKILLCRLSKGALGDDVTSLIGSLVVTRLSLAALSRQDIPEERRVLHSLVVDEVQSFIHGMDFPTILAEARKYRLALTVATQNLSQLPLPSQRAILGNCATIVSFRVSGEDARVLEQEFANLVSAPRLQEIKDYTVYLRTLRDGNPLHPEALQTFPPIGRDGQEADPASLLRSSLRRYARPRTRIESRLLRFFSPKPARR